jgi:hypothetical protein
MLSGNLAASAVAIAQQWRKGRISHGHKDHEEHRAEHKTLTF